MARVPDQLYKPIPRWQKYYASQNREFTIKFESGEQRRHSLI
jgi:hypothetical protein